MLKKYVVIVFVSGFLTAFATPSHVLIIPHGEKGTDSKNINLTTRGYQRACALVSLFTHMPLTECSKLPKNALNTNGAYTLPPCYGQPSALYAQGQRSSNDSIGSIMTLTPLAKQLNLEINQQILENKCDKKNPKKYEGRYIQLLREMEQNPQCDGNMVLICWGRTAIPTITQAFFTNYTDGVRLPQHLRSPKIFDLSDRIFRLTFKNGKITHFDNLAQELLFGDSASSTSEFYTIKSKSILRTK